MPGLDRRWKIFQQVVEDVVCEFYDDDVRLVPMSEVSAEMGMDAAIPDAIHISRAGHRRFAEMLAVQIVPWLEAQEG